MGKLTLDPMRGRSTRLWLAVARTLVRGGGGGEPLLQEDVIRAVPGGDALLVAMDAAILNVEDLTGVSLERIQETARLVAEARGQGPVVFIHTLDRAADHAAGDVEILANLVALLRMAGFEAELLLPRLFSNGAGLELVGAEPGRGVAGVPVEGLAGAASRQELLELLQSGRLRAALIASEDPLRVERSAAWFRNLEFLAVMDWTPTETTAQADLLLPGSPFLEAGGTRCSFDGRLLSFAPVALPPAGISSAEVFARVARKLGLEVPGTYAGRFEALERAVREGLGERVAFLWNTGETRPVATARAFCAPVSGGRPAPMPAPITHGEKYKREIREVGTARFKVRG
jgi:predicted molibdopterin-dependent oxidoreductase YjgC